MYKYMYIFIYIYIYSVCVCVCVCVQALSVVFFFVQSLHSFYLHTTEITLTVKCTSAIIFFVHFRSISVFLFLLVVNFFFVIRCSILYAGRNHITSDTTMLSA